MAHYFFVRWHAYKKLVDYNYMDHVGLFGRLAEDIQQRFGGSISMLDLGCGDAAPLAKWLSHLNIGRYTGVDEAPNALEMARAKLESLHIDHDLRPGELTKILPTLEQEYDVILMSFCLHHFAARERKQQILTLCRGLLKPGGIMAVIDIVSEENESREAYLGRCDTRIKAEYDALSKEELDIILTHIWEADFPESFSTYHEIGTAAGFAAVDQTMLDGTGMHALITLAA